MAAIAPCRTDLMSSLGRGMSDISKLSRDRWRWWTARRDEKRFRPVHAAIRRPSVEGIGR